VEGRTGGWVRERSVRNVIDEKKKHLKTDRGKKKIKQNLETEYGVGGGIGVKS